MASEESKQSDPGRMPPAIPDFDLIRPIGQGGFGQVWLASNRATGHLRAVKVIPLRRSGQIDPAGREIHSITRLEENITTQHPNLLQIHHIGKTDDHLFYVMAPADDISGRPASADSDYRPASLESQLENGPLSADLCLSSARALLSGLAFLHEAGMIHRDVKPANCLFVARQLKLADFGLLTEAAPQVSHLGTVKYMPPRGRMDSRADVWAAGLVIYEMITGLPAENFPQLGDQTASIAENPILGALNRIALRACEPNPEHRFRDAREMLIELESAVQSISTESSQRDIRGPRTRVATTVAILCLATGLVVLALRSNHLAPITAPSPVDVNFITLPYFEATIYVDGRQLQNPAGKPYRTPCTVDNLPGGIHRVVFKLDGHDDLDAGRTDFNQTPEIVARWGR